MESRATSAAVGSKGKKTEKMRRSWSKYEEDALIQSLKASITKGWKSENGFKDGYLTFLEDQMKALFPQTNLRGNPHINSKVHVWKKMHASLATMLTKSGIGWNDSTKTIEASNNAWEDFIKADQNAHTMRCKQWPYYHDWCEIFGNDRATGENVDSFTTAVQNVLNLNLEVNDELHVAADDIFQPFEDASESMSVTQTRPYKPMSCTSSKGKKRKYEDEVDENIVKAINKFADITKDTMSDLIKQLAAEQVVDKTTDKLDDVLHVLGTIGELSEDEKVLVAELLLENPTKLSLFFYLGHTGKISMARRLLKGG